MKPGIHPTWYPDAVVKCACGNTFTSGSTQKQIQVDVCSNCHPFYTGEQRIVDTAGQVERFMKRVSAMEAMAEAQPVEQKRGKKGKRRDEKPVAAPETLPVPEELPLAVAEEEPQGLAPKLPVVEEPVSKVRQPEPVAEIQAPTVEPVAPAVRTPPAREPEPVAKPTVEDKPKAAKPAKAAKKPAAKKPAKKARAKKPVAKKAAAKKRAAPKKKTAPKAKAKAAPKTKASTSKKTTKPKAGAKKKSKK